MKRLISYIVALGLAVSCYADSFLLTTTDAPRAKFRSTSVYVVSGAVTESPQLRSCMSNNGHATCSMYAISAANFAALNSEGGACYQPVAKARKGRPGGGGSGGGGAIGEYDFQSPIGAVPVALILLLGAVYALLIARKQKKCW